MSRSGLRVLILIVAGVILVVASVMAMTRWIQGGGDAGGPVAFTVEEGATGADIAKALEDKGIISSELAFRIYLTIRGGDGSLKVGNYQLSIGMSHGEVLAILNAGAEGDFVKLTIPEGLTTEQIAEVVGSSTHISSEELLIAANETNKRPKMYPDGPDGPDSSVLLTGPLEGFLFPNTYFVDEDVGASALVERMINAFDEATSDVDWEGASELGVTPYEAVIIASLIEEEAKVDEERALVSSVIHNRLEVGMMLGIDATVQYVHRSYDGSPLTAEQLSSNSPYNTRLVAGLPPGPISSPGLASIEAALAPADTNFIYYVLKDCKTHFFTHDFDAFSAARRNIPTDC